MIFCFFRSLEGGGGKEGKSRQSLILSSLRERRLGIRGSDAAAFLLPGRRRREGEKASAIRQRKRHTLEKKTPVYYHSPHSGEGRRKREARSAFASRKKRCGCRRE